MNKLLILVVTGLVLGITGVAKADDPPKPTEEHQKKVLAVQHLQMTVDNLDRDLGKIKRRINELLTALEEENAPKKDK